MVAGENEGGNAKKDSCRCMRMCPVGRYVNVLAVACLVLLRLPRHQDG